ncbi:MAG: ABC transporter ATP-binding protein [Candidatus Omnitrophica bacterium]|nr:ABC transporter ATP-binding protein [Candidatus Omnitrophota bacterium]
MLKVENISKSYTDTQKRVDVLKGVSLTISAGENLAVVGPSGAGKSTLLHIAGGLDRPNEGKVLLNGQDLYRLADAERSAVRNATVGFVFQFYHLLGDLTALENVMLPLIVKGNAGARTREIEEKALQRLNDVGLGARADHKPNQLSGGEQQRVAVARALINDPALLLCDEPTGNLDSASGSAVIDLLFSLNARDRRTVVIVTHDEALARRATRIVRIRDGVLEN